MGCKAEPAKGFFATWWGRGAPEKEVKAEKSRTHSGEAQIPDKNT